MVTGRHWVVVAVVASASWQLVAAERSTVKLRGVVTFSPAAEPAAAGHALPLDGASLPDAVVCTEADAENHRIAQGAYRNGERHGKWTRWFQPDEGAMFTVAEFAEFSAPFTIEVELADGVLHGDWVVRDSQKRRACRWEFQQGKPDGTFTWWYADGHPRREAHFHQGRLEGELREWDADEQLRLTQQYACGKRVEPFEELYKDGKPSCRGINLLAGEVTESTFDWHAGSVVTQLVENATEAKKHGHWDWWHPNGRKELEGDYENGRAVGRFTWWDPNGQKRVEAQYKDGKLDGQVVAWHTNGQKSMQSLYAADVQIGSQKRWNEDGRLIDQRDYLLAGSAQDAEFTTARRAGSKPTADLGVSQPTATAALPVAATAPVPATTPAPVMEPVAASTPAADSSVTIMSAQTRPSEPAKAVAGPTEPEEVAEKAPAFIAPAARPNFRALRTAEPTNSDSRLR